MNWTTKKLGEVCNVQKGTTITQKSAIKGNIPVIGGGTKPTYYHNEANRNANCITVSGSGANAGFVNFWESPIYASDCSTVECNDEKQDQKFVYYFLLSKQNLIYSSFRKGAAQPHVYASDLATIDFPIIPIEEQRRIAAILDKADAIRRKREQALALADDFLRATFLDMFGDPVTNPKGWKFCTIAKLVEDGSILEIQDGNHGELHPVSKDFSDNGIPFVTANTFKNNAINFDICKRLPPEWLAKLRIGFSKPNDVLLTHKGSIGFSCVASNDYPTCILSPQVTYYRLNDTNLIPDFLSAFFQTKWFQAEIEKMAKQSTRAYIGITKQKELKVLVPPVSLQYEYKKRSLKFVELRKRITNSIGENSALFNSLSQQAFSGEL